MTDSRGFRNWRGWRKVTWLVALSAFSMLALIVFFPNTLVNRQIAAGITDYLVAQLGPEAICGEIALGWRQISIRDVILPFGESGTTLTIQRIDVTIDPLIAVSQPSAYERIVRSVSLINPELKLVIAENSTGTRPSASIPPSVFAALGRVDSLQNLSVEGGEIAFVRHDSTLFVLSDVQGGLRTSKDGFALTFGGRSSNPLPLDFRMDGRIETIGELIELKLNAQCDEVALRVDRPGLESIEVNSGELTAHLYQELGVAELGGIAILHDAELRIAGNSIFLPEPKFEFDESNVRWSSVSIRGQGLEANSSGVLSLADSLVLLTDVRADINLSDALQVFSITPKKTYGTARFTGEVGGTLNRPTMKFSVTGDSMYIDGELLREISVSAEYYPTMLKVTSGSVTTNYGDLSFFGEANFSDEVLVSADGIVRPQGIPKVLGQSSDISQIELAVDGSLESPTMALVVRNQAGELLGSGTVEQLDSTFLFLFGAPDGRTGYISVAKSYDLWNVAATNAHILVPIVYPSTLETFSTIKKFEFDFSGDRDSGESALTISSDSSQKTVLSRILSELQFKGKYERNVHGELDLTGNWYGMSGDGDDFFGQGKVLFADSLLRIERVYVDEAGALGGTIRLDTPRVDLNLSIDQLPLSRMPFIANLTDKWNLDGVVSGEISTTGSLDSLDWYADISLVNGVAKGLPGYWGLLTAKGRGESANDLNLSFGRGVRSIFEAAGSIDLAENKVDMRAEFPTSDCADFIQALSGRSGLLSGDLDGEVLIFGKLTAPDVVASIRVTHGEILGELTIDRFALDATIGTEPDERRILAIPQLTFGKEGEYSFSGEMSATPSKDGDFRAYFEGEGDFLDMLQQVDADFTSLGSKAKLRVEVGGTWDAPQFVGGELTVHDGNFTYPPAAPGELTMNTFLRVNGSGVVDSGRIQINAGEDLIRLEFLGTNDPRVNGKKTLVIPRPRIELGVLYVSSSEGGVDVRLPGFMKPVWLGRLTTGQGDLEGISISAFDSSRLMIGGEVLMADARFTFPFLSYGGRAMRPVTKWLVDRLYEAWWDLDISMGSGSHYDVEITGFKDSDLFVQMGKNALLGTVAEYLDHISVDAILSPSESPLAMEGSLVDSSLRLYGKLGGTSGTADYLDQTFWIERLQADFDETSIFPVISGRAATYGVDSVGRTVPVYLTIYEIDEETNSRIPYGRFEDVTYVLEADGYPDQEQVLALLGYDITNFSQGKAEQLLTRTAMTAAKRMWLDPISRKLERATFLDEISLAPGGGASASIFRQQRDAVLLDTLESSGVVRLLKGSNVTVGKYFTKDVFVTYTGELAEAAGEIEGGRLGLIHYWNLQYRVVPLSPDFVLDFAVEYDEASRSRDESIALKYSFVLEP